MNGGNRRQWYLLALLGVSIFAYFRYGGGTIGPTVEGDVGALPVIDADGLVRALKGVSTVKPELITPPPGESSPDRNLFQYGERKPPPLTEEQRKAEEERLRIVEKSAREAAERERVEAEKRAREEQERQEILRKLAPPESVLPPPPPKPQPPPKPKPPEPNFKFMGVLGPSGKKVGVFLEGEKMLLAKKGEILDGKFRILEIGPEWAYVGYVDPAFKDEKRRIDFGPGGAGGS